MKLKPSALTERGACCVHFEQFGNVQEIRAYDIYRGEWLFRWDDGCQVIAGTLSERALLASRNPLQLLELMRKIVSVKMQQLHEARAT